MTIETIKKRIANKKDRDPQFFIKISGLIFIISALIGYVSGVANPLQAEKVILELLESFSFLEKLDPFSVFVFIFLNNSIKSFLALLLGFIFGIFPVLFIFFNGEILGICIAFFSATSSTKLIILSLLPHGIIEVPASLIASGWGMWLGYKFYRFLKHKEPFKKHFLWALKKYLIFIVPLFLIAAFIETYITSWILKCFGVME